MITKDEITMCICSYALFLKEMPMFRYTVADFRWKGEINRILTHVVLTGILDATKYPYECKYSSSNEQLWDTFPWQDFFPDISLTVNNIPDIFLTCFKFPDISRFSRQVVTLRTRTEARCQTLTSPLESKPSSWLSSSSIVLWISRSPPEFDSYLHITASSFKTPTERI